MTLNLYQKNVGGDNINLKKEREKGSGLSKYLIIRTKS